MFLQIENRLFSINHITRATFFKNATIEVHTSDGGYTLLKGEAALDFACWLYNDADVHVESGEDWLTSFETSDPMTSDYETLAAEKVHSQYQDSRKAAGM